MPVNSNGKLNIYCLNVGQGDTTIVITPNNKVIIIDAVKAKKTIDFLLKLGLQEGEKIDHMIISHPHTDHYRAVVPLINKFGTREITFSSLRRYTKNVPGYVGIINTAAAGGIPMNFLSGYNQVHPDASPFLDPKTLRLELLGPSNQFIEDLYNSGTLAINHYSIIARLVWGKFRMVIAGDAQMENWAHFDREKMLEETCTVLRSAHHGSANGTQFERVDRLKPRVVIVSSDPDGKDHLPDLIGCTTMLRYYKKSSNPIVALTNATGSIKIEVNQKGSRKLFSCGEDANDKINIDEFTEFKRSSDPTSWKDLALSKMPT
jgi:beta-lactamase superfamily II metal-dependent hydrolase